MASKPAAVVKKKKGNKATLAKVSSFTEINEAVEAALIEGNLAPLSVIDRVLYYKRTCETVGLNPFTKPFDYLVLNSKLILYANKNCAEQLREIHGVSIGKIEHKVVDGILTVVATATNAAGRIDVSTGAVSFGHLKGNDKANAIMKAETKAKRRVTLSLCGLGMLDQTEVETIDGAQTVDSEWDPDSKAIVEKGKKSGATIEIDLADEPEQPTDDAIERAKLIKDIKEVRDSWDDRIDGSWEEFKKKAIGDSGNHMTTDQLRTLSEAIIDKLSAVSADTAAEGTQEEPGIVERIQIEEDREAFHGSVDKDTGEVKAPLDPLPVDTDQVPDASKPGEVMEFHRKRVGWDAFNKVFFGMFKSKGPGDLSEEEISLLLTDLANLPDSLARAHGKTKVEA